MLMLFTIYFRINSDIVVVNYTDDGSLELGSETSGRVLWKCLNNLECLNWKCR